MDISPGAIYDLVVIENSNGTLNGQTKVAQTSRTWAALHLRAGLTPSQGCADSRLSHPAIPSFTRERQEVKKPQANVGLPNKYNPFNKSNLLILYGLFEGRKEKTENNLLSKFLKNESGFMVFNPQSLDN